MSGNVFTTPTPASRTSRYNSSNMDSPEPTNLFSLPNSSPATVRKTLEVHEEELQRRIQLVAKLGESLMRQQNELRERLREVGEENYDESDEEAIIDPNLKAKLADLERSYNDVERESARAFLSVKPVAANISSSGAQNGVFSSTGSVSPNKSIAPASSRRQRNQPSRIQDIEFAADIGQSLLVEVRRLQALLQEREEALKNLEMEKTRLLEDLGLVTAKVRALEEEDSQLKEINWNLEVVVQEVRSSESEAKDIIERLHNQVNILNREKNEVISKWDDFKLAHQKIAEENDNQLKHNEAELAQMRRHLTTKETECETLTKMMAEMKQELDESYKTNQRLRIASDNIARQHLEPEDAYDSKQIDDETPENTPSVSPVKATPRHSALESETLKSTLHHAHRMIANLKNTIHREKTEKSELRRMLQEARDEVEQARQGVVAPTNAGKQRKGKNDSFKKPSRPLVGLLGESRKPKAEIIALSDGSENDEWIDDPNGHSPTLRPGAVRSRRPSRHSLRRPSPQPQNSFASSTDTTSSFEHSSSFETANEESDNFATANEAETENDVHYQTGLDTGRDEPTSADDLTETEGALLNVRSRRSSTLSRGSRRTVVAKSSYASVRKNSIITDTSEDDSDYQRFQDAALDSEGHYDTGSPVPRHQRFKMRVARGRGRLSHRVGSNGSLYQTAAAQVPDSPIAPRNSGMSNARLSAIGGRVEPPAPAGSLFAELGEGSFMDTEPEDQAEEEEEAATESTTPAKPPVEYVDHGVNTEVPYPEPPPMVVPKISITTGSDPVEELMTPKRSYINTAGSPIQEIMTPRAIFADVAIETGDELMTPKRVMTEASTHTGNDLMTPKPVMAEAGTHTGNELLTPKPAMTDAGSAPLEELMTPRRIMVSSGTDILEELRTPKREMTSSGTQYFETPKPAIVFASANVQTTPVRTSDGATQLGSPIRVRDTRNASELPIHGTETRKFFAGPLMASADVQTSPVRTSDGATQIKTPLGSPIRTRETKDGSTQHIQTPKAQTTSSNVQTTPLRTSDGATQISTPLGTPIRTSDGATQSTPVASPIPVLTNDGATQYTPVASPAPVRTSDGATQSTPVASPIPIRTSDGATQYTPVASPVPVRTNDGATQSTPMASPLRSKETTDGATQVTPSGSPLRGLLPAFGFRSRSQSPARSIKSTKEGFVAAPSEEKEVPREAIAVPVAEVQPVSEGNTPKKVSETIDDANRPITPTPQKENSGFLGSLFTWKRRGSESVGELGVDSDVERPSSAVAQEVQKPALPSKPPTHEVIDAGVQTSIGADFFENFDKSTSQSSSRKTTSFVPLLDSNGNIVPQVIQPTRPSSAGILKTRTSQDSMSLRPVTPTLVRPGSASSAVDRTGAPHPPMPTDHKETIQKHVGPAEVTSMGPPLFAASATKSSASTLRPFTPVNQNSSTIPVIETPKGNGRQSALSRRSSVTSFASELDERFATIGDGVPNRSVTDGGTEPKMIQAITQTMIGEYLWKYTRNAGRGSMSTNRHRRFFWVHPYTRTLYWSDRDPASAGRQELRAKSVSIEGVRVISDDNPMPPGLHRKSLVIITPGRSLKFTAPTSQRHETWFNALSYLLLRTNTEDVEDGETLMAQDFNPGYSTGRNIAPSLSSYNSRTTRNSVSPNRNESSLSNSRPRGPYQGSVNRLSNIFRPGSTLGFSSFRSSKQNVTQTPSLYDASEAHDSQEDLRLQMEREEMEAARMENVRACCDGKHDVGTLNKKGTTPRRSNQLLGHSHSHNHHHHHTHDQPQSAPSPSPSPAPALN